MVLGHKVKWDLVFHPTCFSNTFRVTPPYPPQIRFTSFKFPYHLLIANLYNDNYVDLVGIALDLRRYEFCGLLDSIN